jgi:thiamine-monophosphate kinase
LIHWLAGRLSERGRSLIGNDAAVLPESDRWAVTVDSQIEGSHLPEDPDPAVAARRLLAVNLSDLAAMGAHPAYGFLTLAAPPDFDHRRFFTAILRGCDRYRLELAGGDLARHRQLVATLTLLGRKPAESRWLERGTARPGDGLWLGGTVGEAAAGLALLRHGARLQGRRVELPEGFGAPPVIAGAARRAVRRQLLPEPQLELGAWLGRQRDGAAIDLSDGLARDLHRLCRASGVGAEVSLDRLPLPRGFRRLTERLGDGWQRLALGGGEDYVLLFTLPAGDTPPVELGCTRIGRILEGKDIYQEENGDRSPLPPFGWDHLDADAS